MNLARRRTRLRKHPPETARTVNVIAIRDVEDFLTVARPYRADFMIDRAVVIARHIADMLPSEPLHVSQPSFREFAHKHMEVPVEDAGDEDQALAVGRKSRLDVDRGVLQ